MSTPAPPPLDLAPAAPDSKDWTWVLERPCDDCGFAAGDQTPADVARELRAGVPLWRAVLAAPDAAVRPDPLTWSPLEYAAHVRDVHRTFTERLALMMEHDAPQFPNWDQDATAVEERYFEQDPAVVAADLAAAAEAVTAAYDAVPDDALDRPGLRSNGSAFTIASLARYHLHDVVHHQWDVRTAATRAVYSQGAEAYAGGTQAATDRVLATLDDLAARLGAGARVLEIGSGGGRDALLLEERGLSVRRTDVAPGFVERLRAAGHDADVLDPLTSPDNVLADAARDGAPYDGVWANACLLHVQRDDLPTVLARLHGVVRPGGVLRLSLKEGDGGGFSSHGSIDSPRWFTYWRPPALVDVLDGAGWDVVDTGDGDGLRGERWLMVAAVRRPD